jgi:hypothetical protein
MTSDNFRRAFEGVSEKMEREAIRRLQEMTTGRGFLRMRVVSDVARDRLEIDLIKRPDGSWGAP